MSKQKHRTVLADNRALVGKMAEQNMARKDIAAHFGVSVAAVEDLCERHGFKLVNMKHQRWPNNVQLNKDRALIEVIAPGFTAAELADKWDVTEDVMHKWLENNKIKFKRIKKRGRPAKDFSREEVLTAMQRAGWVKQKAAELLGVSRTKVFRMVEMHEIKKPL